MNKSLLIEMGIVSGILGIISEYLGDIKIVYTILIIMIFIDTVTSWVKAFRNRWLNYKGIKKFVRKVVTYSVTLVTVRLLEIAVETMVATAMLSQVMGIFLIINEFLSILENLAMMGVPLPSNLITFLLGSINIPGIKSMVNSHRGQDEYIDDIDDIIAYQLPTLEDEEMQRMLEIKLQILKDLIKELRISFKTYDEKNHDMLYYKIMNMVSNADTEIRSRWAEQSISEACINSFNTQYLPKQEKWKYEIASICYSDKGCKCKLDNIRDSIMIQVYRTVLEARKKE